MPDSWPRALTTAVIWLCVTVSLLSVLSFLAFGQWQTVNVTIARIDSGKVADVIEGDFRRDSAGIENAERKAKLKKWKGGNKW